MNSLSHPWLVWFEPLLRPLVDRHSNGSQDQTDRHIIRITGWEWEKGMKGGERMRGVQTRNESDEMRVGDKKRCNSWENSFFEHQYIGKGSEAFHAAIGEHCVSRTFPLFTVAEFWFPTFNYVMIGWDEKMPEGRREKAKGRERLSSPEFMLRRRETEKGMQKSSDWGDERGMMCRKAVITIRVFIFNATHIRPLFCLLSVPLSLEAEKISSTPLSLPAFNSRAILSGPVLVIIIVIISVSLTPFFIRLQKPEPEYISLHSLSESSHEFINRLKGALLVSNVCTE